MWYFANGTSEQTPACVESGNSSWDMSSLRISYPYMSLNNEGLQQTGWSELKVGADTQKKEKTINQRAAFVLYPVTTPRPSSLTALRRLWGMWVSLRRGAGPSPSDRQSPVRRSLQSAAETWLAPCKPGCLARRPHFLRLTQLNGRLVWLCTGAERETKEGWRPVGGVCSREEGLFQGLKKEGFGQQNGKLCVIRLLLSFFGMREMEKRDTELCFLSPKGTVIMVLCLFVCLYL